MKQKYWFKQKTYGYGVTPISIEGWLITLLLVLIIIPLVVLQKSIITQNIVGLMIVVLEIAIITMAVLKLTEKRTSGKLGWRWGNKK